jgi:predicted TIM-barrel fold metal-dependent hydrolase
VKLISASIKVSGMPGVTARDIIDVHFHVIPQFFREAVDSTGMLSTIVARYPDWSPQLALDVMDRRGIAVAITSMPWPGVGFLREDQAAQFARRCNDFAADLIAQHPRRFGCFGLVQMHDMDDAIAEARYCLETLHMDGIFLFASYGERFLGDALFDPLMSYLDTQKAAVHVHPGVHPSIKSLALPWPGFMVEFVVDMTRAAVNLLFSGALERFPNIRFILAQGGGALPSIVLRLSVAPMIDVRLKPRSRE